MLMRPLLLLALATASWLPPAAAQTALITSAVTVRAAPDRAFPTVTWLLGGTRVEVVGCIANWRWCDVVAGRDRGWVYARFLSYAHDGRTVTIVNGGPRLGLPSIEFAFGPYWDAHYRDRNWYGQKASWQSRWERLPPPPPWRER
jgi:uncharacterized protein YraI